MLVLAAACITATTWYAFSFADRSRRLRYASCFVDCYRVGLQIWRITREWLCLFLLATAILDGIYCSSVISVVLGVTAGLLLTGPWIAEALLLPFRYLPATMRLVSTLAFASISFSAWKLDLVRALPPSDIAGAAPAVCVAMMIVAVPVSVGLFLLLVAYLSMACLCQNIKHAHLRTENRPAARRAGVATLVSIGALYFFVGLFELVTTEEPAGGDAGYNLNALDQAFSIAFFRPNYGPGRPLLCANEGPDSRVYLHGDNSADVIRPNSSGGPFGPRERVRCSPKP